MTPEQIKAAKTSELVSLYNTLTGGTVRRFASRAAAERRVKEAMAAQSSSVVATSPLSIKTKAKARKISGTNSAPKGRPRLDTSVKLSEGISKLNTSSLRAHLAAWLTEQPSKTATQAAIDAHFGRDMRGVVQKMIYVKHLVFVR